MDRSTLVFESTRWRQGLFAAALTLVTLALATPAHAFCGFYVGGTDQLYNEASQVVLMRDGKLTVLSMQNDYQGPPKDFALVVPVPEVLKKENVKTLPRSVFSKLDRLAAPRLVEYWEQDPCYQPRGYGMRGLRMGGASPRPKAKPSSRRKPKVRVLAKFTVGEYDVVVLGADDSLALDTWIREHGYKIPAGAEKILRPYVQSGMKFFVAKVNVKKVTMKGNKAVLSPLRFHFESDKFFLPVRLGLLSSKGSQDLIVHILARGQRYEVANYDNVTIPTNINVVDFTRHRFGSFYESIFNETLKQHPKSVVTEYAWMASTCDPCPGPPLTGSDVATLGGDLLGMGGGGPVRPTPRPRPTRRCPPGARCKPTAPPMGRPFFGGGSAVGWVLTRLHARYDKSILGEDLVFRAAPPIAGGREHFVRQGQLERSAIPAGSNNFQARYIIRHGWQGPIKCPNPRRGVWGGPWPSLKRGKADPQSPPRFEQIQPVALRPFFQRKGQALESRVSKGSPLGTPVVMLPKGAKTPAPAPGPAPSASADKSTWTPAPSASSAPSAAPSASSAPSAESSAVPPVAPGPRSSCGCALPGSRGSGPLGAFAAVFVGVVLAARRRRR